MGTRGYFLLSVVAIYPISANQRESLKKLNGFVISPSAALRFINRHSGVLTIRLAPHDSRALHMKLLQSRFSLILISDSNP
jgi:hypothetical protein